MIWGELTTVDFESIDRNTPVFLNIGAIEQHGPNLPLETDSLIGRTFLTALNARISSKILILPQMSVCCSTHHMAFPGSLTVSHESLIAYVCDLIESVLHHGFKTIILFNSHGGNLAVGQVIMEKMGAKHPDTDVFLFTWWQIARDALRDIQDSPFGGVGHACEFETSIIAKIAPHYVDGKPVPELTLTPTFEWAEADMLNAPCGSYYRSMTEISGGTGVAGAPAYASAEKGDQIIDVVVGALERMVLDIWQVKSDSV